MSPLEELIRATIKKPLQKEIEAIEGIFVKRTFKKGELFKKGGATSKRLAFITQGSARHYLLTPKGDDITTLIVEKYNFVADLISVRQKNPNPIEIEFLEDTAAMVTSISKHMQLLEENLAYNILIREHLADRTAEFSKRQILFLTGTAKERYEYIIENDPDIIKKFPLKFIATMIGITPTQLSRLRNKK